MGPLKASSRENLFLVCFPIVLAFGRLASFCININRSLSIESSNSLLQLGSTIQVQYYTSTYSCIGRRAINLHCPDKKPPVCDVSGVKCTY